MAEKYTGVSGELVTIQNQTTVFTAKPELSIPEPNNFSRVFGPDSKVRFTLYDHSKGKGEDGGVFVMYNLDLPDIDMLKWDVRNHEQPCGPFQQTKIYGNTPERAGEYQGLCPSFHISIYLQKQDQSGKIKNYPWTIVIANGYAKAQRGKIPGTFYEAPGTFKEARKLYMMFSRKDMIELFEKLDLYKESFLTLPCFRENYAAGYDMYLSARQQKRSTYRGQSAAPSQNAAQNAGSASYGAVQQPVASPQPAQAVNTPPVNAQPSQPQQQAVPQPGGLPPHTTPFDVQVLDEEFFAAESGAFAACRVFGEGIPTTGMQCTIFFDCLPNELLDAQSRKEKIKLLIYPKDGKYRCYGLAA